MRTADVFSHATFWAFIGGVFGASMMGLAAALRSGEELSRRYVASAVLGSAVMGAMSFLLLMSYLRENVPLLIGVSILSGVGAGNMMEMALALIGRKWGVDIQINQRPDD